MAYFIPKMKRDPVTGVMVDTAFLSLKFRLTYMAGPVLTSFKLPSTSVLHTTKKKFCFSKNVYLSMVEVCSYPAQQFKNEDS